MERDFYVEQVTSENGPALWAISDRKNELWSGGKTFRSERNAQQYLDRLYSQHRPPIVRFILTGSSA